METEKKPCKKCNRKLTKTHWTIVVLSFYILFSSIYGTIKLIKDFF
jgi:hypothetical protein